MLKTLHLIAHKTFPVWFDHPNPPKAPTDDQRLEAELARARASLYQAQIAEIQAQAEVARCQQLLRRLLMLREDRATEQRPDIEIEATDPGYQPGPDQRVEAITSLFQHLRY